LRIQPSRVEGGGVLVKQRLVAFAAGQLGLSIELVSGNAVGAVAVGANDMSGHGKVDSIP
jgi:hypothetical protein